MNREINLIQLANIIQNYRIERNASEAENRKSIGAILEDAGLSCNLHLTGEMDFFTILSDELQDKFD